MNNNNSPPIMIFSSGESTFISFVLLPGHQKYFRISMAMNAGTDNSSAENRGVATPHRIEDD